MSSFGLLHWIVVAMLVGGGIWIAARAANAREDRRRAAAAGTKPIGTPRARGSVLRSLGGVLITFGLLSLVWACTANLAIDPALSLADNLHWASTRNSAMLWGFGLIVVGALMRLSARGAGNSAPADAPTDATHVRCPACAEPVRREAIKCKHCGGTLVPQPRR